MEQILSALGIGTVVFVSTNVDDIFLLSAFFSDPSFTSREIIVGQFLGIAALVLVSVACALLTFAIPEGWIGLLGLAPLVIGLKRLWALWRGARDANAVSEQTGGSASRSKVLSVAGITIANGADNLGVYIPLFSNAPHLIPFYSAVFAVMTGTWCALGYYLVNNALLGARIRRYGRAALPFVLIGLGLWILSKALVLFR
jgi:cadmium resistance protein CadD (predicted permease)